MKNIQFSSILKVNFEIDFDCNFNYNVSFYAIKNLFFINNIFGLLTMRSRLAMYSLCLKVGLVFALMQILAGTGLCKDELLNLDIEDLSQINVEEAYATLSTTDPRETPASVTIITAQDIKNSGARSLDELLDIFVPCFQYMYKTQGNQAGIRGIISDRNNKLLLTVNDRSMNIRASDGGAVTERWFSMLEDIRRITVVNGPGSAVYGPGAIAGIINIETWNGKSFQGFEASARGGGVEYFGSLEARYGKELGKNAALFLYYGADYYPGADNDVAPLKFSYNITQGKNTIFYKKHSKPNFVVPRDDSSFRGLARHKLHIQLDGENYELWARYTLSGQRIPADQYFYIHVHPDLLTDNGAGNQQLTFLGKYTHYINECLSFDYMLSYMLSDVQINYGLPDKLHRPQQPMDDRHWSEDETVGRIMAHITLSEYQKFAIGTEYYYNNFGRKGLLYSSEPSNIQGLPIGTKWNSHMISLVGEYQLRFNSDLLGIAGLRVDKHRFTSWMFSPRAALVYSPDASNVFKLIYNHSVRHADDADLYIVHLGDRKKGDIESIDNFEFLYNFQPRSDIGISFSTFYNRHQVVAFDKDIAGAPYKELITTYGRTSKIGLVQTFGLDITLRIHTDNLDARLSHSFTKLLDFDLYDKGIIQNVSASPYGYGNDLANWINNATKLIVNYNVTNRFSFHSNARVYWGLPGGEDMARYNLEKVGSPALPIAASDDRAFDISIFLSMGLEYRLTPNTDVSLHGYNLMGIFDKDLNKRNFFQRTSMYRDAAPSVAIRICSSF